MIIAVYKPKGPTSNDIIQLIKKKTGIKKIGHAGTLDPLAKGILVIAIGRQSTKELVKFVQKEKRYNATIRLGATSATDDAEGPIQKNNCPQKPNLRDIKKIINSFQGRIKQVPPLYSAVKVRGKEAYKLARSGKLSAAKRSLKPRLVEIKKIQIISYKWPYLKLQVTTGPGVYIRSLARDIGKQLKTGGYLYNLERTEVGQFNKKKALTLSQLLRLINNRAIK